MAVDKVQVKNAVEMIIRVAKGISAITPTAIDDTIVNTLASFGTEDWFIDLVVYLLNLPGGSKQAHAVVKQMIAEHEAHQAQ